MKIQKLVNGRGLIALLGISLALTLGASSPVQAQEQQCRVMQEDFATYTACIGVFPDPTWAPGRPFSFMVPNDWNGTLVLVSQGYAYPGSPPPPRDEATASSAMAGDYFKEGTAIATTGVYFSGETASIAMTGDYFEDFWWALRLDQFGKWLLENGYAIASSWAGTGYTVERALHNQIATLDVFASSFGPPTRTIAYGGSLGGLITPGLIQQHPERFDGALAVEGLFAGSVGMLNAWLDVAFTVQKLMAPQSALQIVHITNPGTPTSGNMGLAMRILDVAQSTPKGRARIALACAFYDIPGWFDVLSPEPAADDFAAREFNQFLWLRYVLAPLMFGEGRSDIEWRAGGNPSWNTGVNYEAQLERSVNDAEVLALYQAAGVSLDDDLARLKAAPRIAADPVAVTYMSENIAFDGDLGGVPVLTASGLGDGLATVEQASAYRSAVLEAQNSHLLRQAFVNRAGHGPFTAAELIAAFQALLHRIDTGMWDGVASPEALNAAALAFGPTYNVVDLGGGQTSPSSPMFVEYDPAPFLRPYDLAVRDVTPDPGGVLVFADASRTIEETPPVAGPVLNAWPLPYRGGALQVSLSSAAGMGAGAQVAIYDLSGRRVRLLSGADGAARQWDGRDASGVAVSSGIYFLRATGIGWSDHLRFAVLR